MQAQCLTEYGAGALEARPPSPAPALPFSVDDVCRPGNTLLWDLLQDGAIVSRMTSLVPYYCRERECRTSVVLSYIVFKNVMVNVIKSYIYVKIQINFRYLSMFPVDVVLFLA